MTAMDQIIHMWQNGGRGLLLASVYLMASAIALIAALLYVLIPGTETPARLTVELPIHILSPVIHEGQALVINPTWCNNTDADLTVTFVSAYTTEGVDGKQGQRIESASGTTTFKRGCESFRLQLPAPPVPPGTWTRLGYVELADGARVPYYTEEFEVIP